MACLPNEVRIVILDLETSKQKVIKIKHPWMCATSQHLLAITTTNDGLHLFSTDGVLVRIVPKSTKASCAAFHTLNTNILPLDTRVEQCAFGIWTSKHLWYRSKNTMIESQTFDSQLIVASLFLLRRYGIDCHT